MSNAAHLVYLSLGSNIDREHYIRQALDELQQKFGAMDVSSVYESAAVGFEGDAFYNLVTGIVTNESPGNLSAHLKQIESSHGRVRGGEKFAPRTLDIDILTCDQLTGDCEGIELPRQETVEQAYILAPFAEIAPDLIIPGMASPLSTLWQHHDGRDTVERLPFTWQGNHLPLLQLPGKAKL